MAGKKIIEWGWPNIPGLRRGDRHFVAIGFSIDANGVTLAVRYREGGLASMLKG